MLLQEIFNDLTYGEFSQIKLGGNPEGKIDDANYNALLTHVNLGLTDLHRRFSLKMNSIEVVFNTGRYRYHLSSEHKYSDESLVVGDFRLDVGLGTLLVDTQENADPEYIRDQPYAEFQDDILLITRVETTKDYELPLNKIGNPWSFMTPKANVLEVPRRIVDGHTDVPHFMATDRVFVHYRQGHPRIQPGAGQFDANRVEIDLPETHRQALLYFIASRVMNPIGMGQEFNAGNIYYGKFLKECQDLTEQGMYIDQTDDQTKFNARGFV
jgi:hypothetical protein